MKSNAILLAHDGATVGVGMGQVNRVDSAHLAVNRAGADRARGSVAASDAFFPFPDGLEVLIDGRGAGGRAAGRLDPRQPGDRGRGEGRADGVPHRHPALLPLMDADKIVHNETFSGKDWALAEVSRVHYEDCAFHDVDWSEARLTGCTFTHCQFGNVRFNAAVLERTRDPAVDRCSAARSSTPR